VAASRDGRWLAYTANEAGASSLYLAPAARPQKARRIAVPRGVISALLFDRASRRLGVTLSGAASEADVFAVDAPSGKVTRWTSSEVGGLDPATFVTPELIEVPSFDKLKIRAWYYRPSPSWRPARKPLPVVVSLHGGPEGESVASFSPIVQYLVNDLGAAVLAPNVRGSGGFGKKFLALDDGALREGAVKDLGALLDWIATRPELDKTRVAVIGGSYAGYLVLASLIQFGDRLRCGVATAAITNFVTFLARTEDVRRDARRQEYGDERDPRTRDLLLRLSPLPNAAALKQPLFVVHGLNDPRVPVAEVEQLVQTVRRNGAEVWYLLASDEGHGLQKRANLDFYQNAFLAFFERFLLE